MRRWTAHIVTALGYLLPGVAGLQLGVLQGYASPLFPAAGWALAVMLFYGPRVLPAIWVGAFFTNLVVEIGNGVVWSASSGVIAVLIATGASIQAWLAARLVRRRLSGAWLRLENDSDILWFTVLGGPVACLVSATVGVSALMAFGIVAPVDYLYSWWNWWLGDTLGVLIGAPLSLLLLARRIPVWRKRIFALAVPTLATLSIIIGAFVYAAYWERQQLANELERRGSEIAFRLQQRFDGLAESLSALRSLLEVSPVLSDAAYGHFARPILKDHPELAALSYGTHVTDRERAAFEARQARRLGLPDFAIRERDDAGRLVRSAMYAEYVPVTMIAPMAGNASALGFDILSEPVRREAIRQAMLSGAPVATAAVQLIQDNESRPGVLILHPTYRRDISSPESRGELQGFATAAIRADDMVTTVLGNSIAHGVRLAVFDMGDRAWGESGRLLFGTVHNDAQVWRTDLHLADRVWRLSASFSPEYVRESRSLLSTVVGIAGMLFVAVLQLFLLSMTGRATVIERKVAEQTWDLQRLDEKLRERMLEMQSILDNSSVGITFVRDRKQMWSNRRMAEMFGYPEGSLAGVSTSRFYASEDEFTQFGREAYPVLLKGERFSCERQMRHADGHLMWMRMNGKLIDPAKPEAGSIWVFEDVSEQKATEADLIRAKEAAEAASVAKSQFLATMSHEIRTPMNGILGMAQLAMMPGMSDAEREDCLRTLLDSGQALLSLLNDILDLSRVEAGKLSLDAGVFDLAVIVHEVEMLFRGPAAEKSLQLSSVWQGPEGECYEGDAMRLRQILSNLVGNAIKFTHDGEVRIEARVVSRDETNVWVELAVVDTGIGIPADKQSLLFQPFSQADSSTTREYGGTGLGLSIVQGLVSAMGGEVGVESVPGEGSRFSVCIPLRVAAAGVAKAPEAAVPAPAAEVSAHILVAEDNPTNRKVLVAMLERIGCRITLAGNGLEALDRVIQGEPADLVLMDIQMPIMDGIEATQMIRSWEKTEGRGHLPIIAVTASAYEEDRRKCMAAGMDDYLSKPVDFVDLHAALLKWLPADRGVSTSLPPEEAPVPAPVDGQFDGAALVRRLNGDLSLARSLVELVQEDVEQRLRELQTTHAAGDAYRASRAAHGIKGMAGDLGAVAFAEQAKALEHALRDGLPVTPEAVAALGECYADLKPRLQAWLAETAPSA